MMLRLAMLGVLLAGLSVAGCGLELGGERNAFLTLTEKLGISAGGESVDAGAGAGTAAEVEFRSPMTFTFTNNHTAAELDVSFAAWVNAGSIRSAQQQDALLRGGYVQLIREVRLGTPFVLPVGTFVYDGPGTAGATTVRLGPSGDEGAAVSTSYTLITPDVFLAFSQPPVSCDSVAFTFVGPVGTVTGPVTDVGGFKTFSQVDVYECDPLQPGLFLKVGGGARQDNEFTEGENVLFEFNPAADAEGNFCNVTISE